MNTYFRHFKLYKYVFTPPGTGPGLQEATPRLSSFPSAVDFLPLPRCGWILDLHGLKLHPASGQRMVTGKGECRARADCTGPASFPPASGLQRKKREGEVEQQAVIDRRWNLETVVQPEPEPSEDLEGLAPTLGRCEMQGARSHQDFRFSMKSWCPFSK